MANWNRVSTPPTMPLCLQVWRTHSYLLSIFPVILFSIKKDFDHFSCLHKNYLFPVNPWRYIHFFSFLSYIFLEDLHIHDEKRITWVIFLLAELAMNSDWSVGLVPKADKNKLWDSCIFTVNSVSGTQLQIMQNHRKCSIVPV